jgi:uncharacterized membrane protein
MYLTLKWIHVVSSTIIFGTGLGTAFFMFSTALTRETVPVASVARRVVIADWLFTTPTAILQPATGLWLASVAGFPLTRGWVGDSIWLYLLGGGCWLPVVWLQMRMARLAGEARRDGIALPREFWHCFWTWAILGVPAFVAFLAIFWLMVVKPG